MLVLFTNRKWHAQHGAAISATYELFITTSLATKLTSTVYLNAH